MGVLDRMASRMITEAVATALVPDDANDRRGIVYGIDKGGTKAKSVGTANWGEKRIQLESFWNAYKACPWASESIDVTARTATSAGIRIVPDDDNPATVKPDMVVHAEWLFDFVNLNDDAKQLMASAMTDLLAFGDMYLELGFRDQLPNGLWLLDSPTMSIDADEQGNVFGYRQDVDGDRIVDFDATEVLHAAYNPPRGGMYGLGFIERAYHPIANWIFVAACLQEWVRQGMPGQRHIDLPASYNDVAAQRFLEQYQTTNLGVRNMANPLLTKGGAVVHELSDQKAADFKLLLVELRDEIVSTSGVPPAMVGIIESGNLGGGTGDSQWKTFQYNKVLPIQQLVAEKLTFRILKQQLGVDGWHVEFGHTDYRDSKYVEDIKHDRITVGLDTINESRAEEGKKPIEGGDNAIFAEGRVAFTWDTVRDAIKPGSASSPKDPNAGPAAAPPASPDDAEKSGTKEELTEQFRAAFAKRRRTQE